MRSDPLNTDRPADIPLNPRTTWHVIARLVWPDREEWRPAQTCRWTDTHALAQWWDNDGTERYNWLRTEDIRRAIVTERKD